ncbi:MAG: sulfatase-like hydrolase/transferase, partial [Alphaproteobacteria bacterium]|nr:sulfatase-like hydrolase/transferase [Alphaproteobacteria bacterium]
TDQHIITVLNQQTFSKHNFIVLHQRSVHTPYSKVFSKDFLNRRQFSGAENSVIDEYDNAMVYNDYVISSLFNYFNKQKIGKFYIIWASDHNEFLGENGLFGHGLLNKMCADIPVIVQSNDREFLDKFKKIYKPNHYEIAKFIARLLGYEIINPNEDGKTFYISGSDFNGKYGYIKYEKDSGKRKVTYFNGK